MPMHACHGRVKASQEETIARVTCGFARRAAPVAEWTPGVCTHPGRTFRKMPGNDTRTTGFLSRHQLVTSGFSDALRPVPGTRIAPTALLSGPRSDDHLPNAQGAGMKFLTTSTAEEHEREAIAAITRVAGFCSPCALDEGITHDEVEVALARAHVNFVIAAGKRRRRT